MNSKRKGNAGERELLHLLEGLGLDVHRNDQTYIGGKDNPDISLEVDGKRFHLEVKRVERFNAYEAMEQAIEDSNGHAMPIVVHRRNRKPWLVVLRLGDFLALGGACNADPGMAFGNDTDSEAVQ